MKKIDFWPQLVCLDAHTFFILNCCKMILQLEADLTEIETREGLVDFDKMLFKYRPLVQRLLGAYIHDEQRFVARGVKNPISEKNVEELTGFLNRYYTLDLKSPMVPSAKFHLFIETLKHITWGCSNNATQSQLIITMLTDERSGVG